MMKERIPISGDLGSTVKQLMEYAGWYEGRSVDISIAEKYYAEMCIRDSYRTARGGSDQVFHGQPYSPKSLSGDPHRCGRERRPTKESCGVF